MPLERPIRPPAGAVSDAVRRAILDRAHKDLGMNAAHVLEMHKDGEYLGDTRDLFADLERRYKLSDGEMERRVMSVIEVEEAHAGASYRAGRRQKAYGEAGAGPVLLALPDAEFLTAIEHAIQLGATQGRYGVSEYSGINTASGLANDFMDYADGALHGHGAPYRVADDARHFEWVGDPKQHELTVQPVLQALADPRLAGAQAEFEEALRKRRGGTPKDLEDAVDEAAKSVESILQVLAIELRVKPPRSQQVTPLFDSLVAAGKLPGYVDKLIAAAAGPRNHMASHGQGGRVREVREELAEASIASAATAITFLAHYLP